MFFFFFLSAPRRQAISSPSDNIPTIGEKITIAPLSERVCNAYVNAPRRCHYYPGNWLVRELAHRCDSIRCPPRRTRLRGRSTGSGIPLAPSLPVFPLRDNIALHVRFCCYGAGAGATAGQEARGALATPGLPRRSGYRGNGTRRRKPARTTCKALHTSE